MNKTKKIIITIALIISSMACIACNSSEKKESKHQREKTEETTKKEATHLDSDVKIPEETNGETSETTVETTEVTEETTVETTAEVTETQEQTELPMFELDLDKTVDLFPNWAENRGGIGVQSVYSCQMGKMLHLCDYSVNYPKSAPEKNQVPFIEGLLAHPNTIPIFVYDDFNDWGNPFKSEGQTYYMKLDGVNFPDINNLAVFFGRFRALQVLGGFKLYVDSDFIPDENGEIHGIIYVTGKISEYDCSFSWGEEIYVENLVQLNEWMLAMGLAEPDRNYQGDYADIYNQYPDLPSDFEGYPLGCEDVGIPTSYSSLPSWFYQNAYDFHSYLEDYVDYYEFNYDGFMEMLDKYKN